MITRRLRLSIFTLLVTWLLVFQPAQAHSSSNSFIAISPSAAGLSVRLDVSVRDADLVFDLDQDRDGQVRWSEVQAQSAPIQSWLSDSLQLQRSSQACLLKDADVQASRHGDGTYISVQWRLACPGSAADPLVLHYKLLFDRDPLHRGLLTYTVDGQTTSALLSPERQLLTLPAGGIHTGQILLHYVLEGIWHIWIGLDHVLFLISLLLLAPLVQARRQSFSERGPASFRRMVLDVFTVVTAFTLAHSITLALSVLELLRPSAAYVEPAIALSVSLAAFNNLLGAKSIKRWPVAFVFGLIHGFGFANVLLDLGLPASALAVALGGFNVGVELGQLAIVLAFLPLAWWLRDTRFYRQVCVRAGSLLMGLLGAYWTLERLGLLPGLALFGA
jgi:hypothetical protein